jgi:hypothetical protein
VDLHHLLFAGFYRRTVHLVYSQQSSPRLSEQCPAEVKWIPAGLC